MDAYGSLWTQNRLGMDGIGRFDLKFVSRGRNRNEPRMKKPVPQSPEQSLVATLQEPVPQSLGSIFTEYIEANRRGDTDAQRGDSAHRAGRVGQLARAANSLARHCIGPIQLPAYTGD
jgi:hypothetical protein